jgi:hypothetical protein
MGGQGCGLVAYMCSYVFFVSLTMTLMIKIFFWHMAYGWIDWHYPLLIGQKSLLLISYLCMARLAAVCILVVAYSISWAIVICDGTFYSVCPFAASTVL